MPAGDALPRVMNGYLTIVVTISSDQLDTLTAILTRSGAQTVTFCANPVLVLSLQSGRTPPGEVLLVRRMQDGQFIAFRLPLLASGGNLAAEDGPPRTCTIT